MNKKGYTLSEVLVALAIIAFISAMTIPTIVSLADSSKRPMFRSAYRMLEVGISQLINDASIYPGTQNLGDPEPHESDATIDTFCEHFANLINTIDVNCGDDATKAYSFIASNGMVWYGYEGMTPAITDAGTVKIKVDIDGEEKGANTLDVDVFELEVAGSGKITVLSEKGKEYLLKGGINN